MFVLPQTSYIYMFASTAVSTQSDVTPISKRKWREIQLLIAYRHQSHVEKAQKYIKMTIQNQRQNNFRKLREAFKLIVAYEGPFLQTYELKKEVCLFLREEALGPHFIDIFDSVGK